ncbi:MAG: CDP-diacylglycerol--glycerol-3-phosphate 3-phosphatidyltransferase [Mycoplasmataceae bacterium]|nr:CDP-diacylglycerol--glycerol-3-phosphate 3-phosphatidyltransferase [Mycoplasmataceae bacterium]
MNTPNKLTLLRIILVIPFITLLGMAIYYFFEERTLADSATPYLLASGGVFTFAMITDALDGYLARKNNQVTTFGKLFDPIADKFITTTAFIGMAVMGIVPFWVTILFVLRDILVDGSRNLAASKNVKVAASVYGKIKTVAQTIGIMIILFATPFIVTNPGNFITLTFELWMLNIPVFIALVASLISGYLYFKQITQYINSK